MSGQGLEFEVFTLFPDLMEAFWGSGLVGKAVDRGLVRVHATDYRGFATDNHRTVDDAPFGGGAGMVMKVDVVVAALEHVERERGPFHKVLLTPSAPRFDQAVAERLASLDRVGLLCGRYEGIDDRVRETFVDECISIGDFVLNGGEIAAMAVIEATARLREGVLGNPESVRHESFAAGPFGPLLEHPHYTRPATFRTLDVPAVLLDGDHAAITRWRLLNACARTWRSRPELRPRRVLQRGQPVWIAVGDDSTASQWRDLRRSCPRIDAVVQVRTRRELMREARRAGFGSVSVAGLSASAKHAHPGTGTVCELLDLLGMADAAPGPEAPLVFAWPEQLARTLGAPVVFAPMPRPDPAPLATHPAMIDSSQPQSGEFLAALARSLCDALETGD